jgi:glycosyltransferase involved in cell wall biosynthesis
MPKTNYPTVSVVVCSFNGERGIEGCLRGLIAQNYPKDKYTIMLVDDGSTDNTVAIAKSYGATIVSHGQNHGVQHARNTGMKHATGEIIAYLDDDCVVTPDWLAEIVAPFADPQVAAVGGRVVAFKTDRLSERYMEASGYGNPEPLAPPIVAKSQSILRRLYAYLHSMYRPINIATSPVEAQAVYTANVAYRASAMKAISGFDSALRSNEDSDIANRLRANGGKLMFAPGATAKHRHHQKVWHFIRQTFYRAGDTVQFYKKSKTVPPIFPFPLLYVFGGLVLTFLQPMIGLLFILTGPALLYNSWIFHAFRAKKLEYVFYAYIQMVREIAMLLGFVRGYLQKAEKRRGVVGSYATRNKADTVHKI